MYALFTGGFVTGRKHLTVTIVLPYLEPHLCLIELWNVIVTNPFLRFCHLCQGFCYTLVPCRFMSLAKLLELVEVLRGKNTLDRLFQLFYKGDSLLISSLLSGTLCSLRQRGPSKRKEFANIFYFDKVEKTISQELPSLPVCQFLLLNLSW